MKEGGHGRIQLNIKPDDTLGDLLTKWKKEVMVEFSNKYKTRWYPLGLVNKVKEGGCGRIQ